MESQEKLLLTDIEAAALLNVSPAFLRRDRTSLHSEGIPFVRIGTLIRYGKRSLEQWISDRIQRPAITQTSHPLLAPPTAPIEGRRRRGRPTKAEQIARRRAA